MDANKFWHNIELARGGENYNVSELAREISISRSTLQTWIQNNSFPSLEVALQLASVVGESVEYLATGHDEEESEKAESTILMHLCREQLYAMDADKLRLALSFLEMLKDSSKEKLFREIDVTGN